VSGSDEVVIVGAGLAGFYTARALRERGHEGPITLLGREPREPYLRPLLSKEFLRGEADADALPTKPADWYAEQRIELRIGTAVASIDRAAGAVTLADGERVGYRWLVLATGSEPRRLDVAGADLPGVLALRSREQGELLRHELADGGRRLVVVGSGLIGMEVAASARQLGNDVTVVSRGIPLTVLGPRIGSSVLDLHRAHGVDVRTDARVAEFEGDTDRLSAVRLASGERVEADLALVAIGAAPDVVLARDAGLAVDDGVLVDPGMRTDDPAILAVGDIANAVHPHTGRRSRSEHWSHARGTAGVAADTILERDSRYAAIPFFSTEHFGRNLGCSGFFEGIDGVESVVRPGPDGSPALAVWLVDGRLVAAVTVDRPDDDSAIQKAIGSDVTADVAGIADPSIPLTTALATA
jgi:3-phenylpropionate/trans-cinnamate dioxygenase ferredoxin reductase subunit